MDKIAYVRRLLRELDEATATLEQLILGGKAQSWEAYRGMTEKRLGLLTARALITDGLTEDEARDLRPR